MYEPEALAFEKPSRDLEDEYRRKVRMFEHCWLITLRGRMLRDLPPAYLSSAKAAAEKARQNNISEVRAVKRITIRTPSTSKPRMPAIQMLKPSRVSESRANSRQPSNQF